MFMMKFFTETALNFFAGLSFNVGMIRPGWKVCQLRTECQETDKILRTKNEINVRTKIKMEIARDGPIRFFMIMFYDLIMFSELSFSWTNFDVWVISTLGKIPITTQSPSCSDSLWQESP